MSTAVLSQVIVPASVAMQVLQARLCLEAVTLSRCQLHTAVNFLTEGFFLTLSNKKLWACYLDFERCAPAFVF